MIENVFGHEFKKLIKLYEINLMERKRSFSNNLRNNIGLEFFVIWPRISN